MLPVVAAVLLGVAPLPRQAPVIAVVGVTVLPMDGPALPDRTVLVRSGRITAVGPRAGTPVPRGARRIDGRGRFLIPGLTDLHVHVTADDLPLFLAAGVTAIREMNGSPAHLALRAEIREGRRLGPTMSVAGTLLAGVRQPWRHLLLTDDSAARAAVTAQMDAGYDYLKIYEGLTAPVYQAIAAAATARGATMIGHLPRAVGLAPVLAAGQRTLTHVDQILASIEGLHQPDSAAVAAAIDRIRAAGVPIEPTLAALQNLGRLRTAEVQARLDAPEVALVDPGIRSWWASLRRPTAPATPENLRITERQRWFTGALYRSGVTILVGTDTPNGLLVPGMAIVDELLALEAAGIPRGEALRLATAGGAEALGRSGEAGTIAVGKRADLVLLDADPTASLTALRRPAGVMIGGTWLDRDELDRLVAAVRARRTAPPPTGN